MVDHRCRDVAQRLTLVLGVDRAAGDETARVGGRRGRCPLEFQDPVLGIDADERPRTGNLLFCFVPAADRFGVDHRVPGDDLELLVRVELVAVDGRSLLGAGRTEVGEPGDRL